MNANRQNTALNNQGATLVATLAETPEFEVEQLAAYDAFTRQIDADLALLESRYAAFCTPDSLRVSLGR